MKLLRRALGLLAIVFLLTSAGGTSQAESERTEGERITALENRVQGLYQKIDKVEAGGLAFLAGAFCALWAQQTRRNAWLWFFLGAIFNVVAILVLLYKNAEDLNRLRRGV